VFATLNSLLRKPLYEVNQSSLCAIVRRLKRDKKEASKNLTVLSVLGAFVKGKKLVEMSRITRAQLTSLPFGGWQA
jgi:hypothetical protein